MANLPISVLPNVTATGVTPNDLLVIVNYDTVLGDTKNITALDLKTYINSGSTQLYEVGSGTDSTQRIGVCANASGQYSVVSGGFNNITLTSGSTIGGGIYNTIDSITTAGCCGAQVYGSTIGGGFLNTISSYSGSYNSFGNTIAGGTNNVTVSSEYNGQTIGGGVNNTTSSYYSTVSGGYNNKALRPYSNIAGGVRNINYGDQSFIGGGSSNEVGQGAGISGVILKVDIVNYSGSGVSDGIYTSNGTTGSGTGGVFQIQFKANKPRVVAILNGGQNYQIGDFVVLLGSDFTGGSVPTENIILEVLNVSTSIPGIADVIGGGQLNTITSCFSVISGGANNTSFDCNFTFIGGGVNNTINSCCSTIVGGDTNKIIGCTYGSFIGGGSRNILELSTNSIIGGGDSNTALASSFSVISGGRFNTSFQGCWLTISGGYRNTTSCVGSTVSGGVNNTSSGLGSTVSGDIVIPQ